MIDIMPAGVTEDKVAFFMKTLIFFAKALVRFIIPIV